LYLISDFAYLLIYYVFGYRKKVVLSNLDIAFPQKSKEEKEVIAKKFYRNLTDTFAEIIKLFSVNKRFLNKHAIGNFEVLDELYAKGKRCQVHLGHNFNWELCNLTSALHIKHKFLGVYMPLENKVFDRLFRKLRTKYNTVLVSAKDMKNDMMQHRGTQYALGLVADQTPANHRAGYWVNFFGRPTSFVRGPEKGAISGDIPVVFCHITKRKRGHYQLHFEVATENPAALQAGELTKRYVQYLEKVITAHPEMWLWSHRRWKLQWKPEYGEVL
jgi:KDO2-lipid IV(A) lauroyltransferase